MGAILCYTINPYQEGCSIPKLQEIAVAAGVKFYPNYWAEDCPMMAPDTDVDCDSLEELFKELGISFKSSRMPRGKEL